MQDNEFIRELIRIPGFYRPWELPQLLRLNEVFQIEDAGTHSDGSPLLAVYSTRQHQFARVLEELWSLERTAAMRPSGPVSEPRK
jgi:hypothetical protein